MIRSPLFGATVILLLFSQHAHSQACGTVAECAQKAVTAAQEVRATLNLLIPPGAVMAFNREECPDGWKPFAELSGRMIVGAGFGNRDQHDDILQPRALGENGGAVAHRLTINEMPEHSHSYVFSSGDKSPQHVDYTKVEFGAKDTTNQTSAEGNGAPHNNMPPFYVLTYCERQ